MAAKSFPRTRRDVLNPYTALWKEKWGGAFCSGLQSYCLLNARLRLFIFTISCWIAMMFVGEASYSVFWLTSKKQNLYNNMKNCSNAEGAKWLQLVVALLAIVVWVSVLRRHWSYFCLLCGRMLFKKLISSKRTSEGHFWIERSWCNFQSAFPFGEHWFYFFSKFLANNPESQLPKHVSNLENKQLGKNEK